MSRARPGILARRRPVVRPLPLLWSSPAPTWTSESSAGARQTRPRCPHSIVQYRLANLTRHELLTAIHRAYRPRSYLEIGIRTGRSLALSRARTIAIDPAFKVTSEIQCDVQLVKATSDEFFSREDALAHFADDPVDLAFIDGLHLFEFALRDFINVERHATWTSVILVDDVLPRTVGEASRERGGRRMWTGDVFKLIDVLAKHRPDLLAVPLATKPTGVLLVLGADSASPTLADHYDAIVSEHVHADPQHVPDRLLSREGATDPASLAHSSIWNELRTAREAGLERADGWEGARRSGEAAARPASPRTHRRRRRRSPAATGTAGGLRRPLRPLRRWVRRWRRTS